MAQTEIAPSVKRGRAQLIASLAEARAGINEGAAELGDLINVPKRIRQSLTDTPMKRAATALVAGLISSKFLSGSRDRPRGSESGLIQRWFPDLDFQGVLRLLLKWYLEPGEVDPRALLRERLRDYLK